MTNPSIPSGLSIDYRPLSNWLNRHSKARGGGFAIGTLIFLPLLLFSTTADAELEVSADQLGRTIFARFIASDDGFKSSVANMRMTIRNRRGRTAERRLELKTLEGTEPAGDRSVIRFLAPGDIVGTALLSHSFIAKEDQQWLFLPSLNRVKRISTANKSGPFVGSEFAYEDLTGQELDKYRYVWERTEELDGRLCDVIRRIPNDKRSGYAYQLAWIDRDTSQLRQIEYYNRGKRHSKTLQLTDIRQHEDKYFRPHTLIMKNHINGRDTNLVVESITFDVGFILRDFDRAYFADR